MEMATVRSVLDSVTVYSKGAICTRLARLDPEGGLLPRRVRIVGLPLSLKEGSLRARVVLGPSDLAVCDVRAGFEAELPPEVDVPAEQRALEQAQDSLGALELELSTVQCDITQIGSLRPSFLPRRKGDPAREAPVEAILELAGFVGGELETLHTQRLELERRLVDARNEVALRRARLAEASSAHRTERARLTRTAVVSLGPSAKPVSAELALEYFVPGARWVPGYELRLASTLGGGTLRMRASIVQRSGEDWSNVRLAVSTADLDRRTGSPELKSLRLGRTQPSPARSGWREPPPGLDELFAAYDEALRRRPAVQVAKEIASRGPPLPAGRPASAGVDDAPAPLRVAEPEMEAPPRPPRHPAPARPPPSAPAAKKADAQVRSRASATLAGGDAAKASPPPAFSGAVLESTLAYGAPSAAAPEPESVPAPELELGGELLDYDRLRLPGGEAGSHRGRLSAHREPLQGLWVAARVSVEVEVLVATLAQEQRLAVAVESLAAPPFAVPPRQSAGSYDYRYQAEHRVNLEGDGAWHSVPIGAAEVTLAPSYLSVPSLEDRVYRTLKVTNRSSHALLAGGAEVTLGDEFLMSVPFPTIAPRGEERVGLGVEESIKVSRNTFFNESTGGLLAGSTVLAHELRLEVANRLAHSAEIEIRERVPVSQDDDIKVEESQVEPPWKPDEGAREGVHTSGARSWRVSLPAGGKAALFAKYVIRLPSGKVLVGGNRRV